MAIRRRTDYDVGARVVGEIFGAAQPEKQYPPAAAPSTINLDTVRWLHRPRRFAYRERRYTIKKVPWQDGIAMEYAHDRIRDLYAQKPTREVLEELDALIADTLDIIWRLTERRWWWGSHNPFHDPTEAEFFQLLSFYSECRTLLPDLALESSPGSIQRKIRSGSRSPLGTLPTALRRSPSTMAAG